MIRQVFKIKFPAINYMNNGTVVGHGIRCLVSKNVLSQKRLYSAGSSSPGKRLKKIVYTTGALALGTGGLVLYAQYDENFQSWLNDYIPGYKSMFKGENILQVYIVDPVLNFKDTLVDSTSKLIGQGESDVGSAKPKETSKVETIKKVTPSVPVTKSDATPASIIELEKVINTTAQECMQSYNSVVKVFKDYGEAVQRLVDNSFHEIDSRLWTDIGKKQEEKQKLLYITEAKIDAAMKLIDKMELLLQDTTLPTASDIKQRVIKNMNRIMDDILKIKTNLQNEILNSSVTKKHWKDLQEARKYFFEELDNLIPNKDLYDTKVHLSEDELNLFLVFAYQKILYYQNELRKFEGRKDKELNSSLNGLKEDEVVDTIVQTVVEKERRKLQEEFENKELAVLLEAKRHTRRQVKLQAEAHYDILKEAVLNKEEEMKRKFRRELENKIDELKTDGKINIASMVGRLKGYNDAVKKRLLEKKQSRDAQELWCACQTLRNTIELPRITKPSVDQLMPLKSDVKNIIKSSEGDEFVTTVASTIPKVALDRGVYPKTTIRDRFLKVERVASLLAQVDESELSIPKMFVSWLQSFLVIKNIDPINSNELANEPVDISSLSTHDILHRARYWLDRGDFLQAVRYMNLLTGAPRAVAKDWIKETTILLETIQAADILLAHACAGSFKKPI